jgi:hypothetical protein
MIAGPLAVKFWPAPFPTGITVCRKWRPHRQICGIEQKTLPHDLNALAALAGRIPPGRTGNPEVIGRASSFRLADGTPGIAASATG